MFASYICCLWYSLLLIDIFKKKKKKKGNMETNAKQKCIQAYERRARRLL